MSRAEVFVAMRERALAARSFLWKFSWWDAGDMVAFYEEKAGRGEEFWDEVDKIIKEG